MCAVQNVPLELPASLPLTGLLSFDDAGVASEESEPSENRLCAAIELRQASRNSKAHGTHMSWRESKKRRDVSESKRLVCYTHV